MQRGLRGCSCAQQRASSSGGVALVRSASPLVLAPSSRPCSVTGSRLASWRVHASSSGEGEPSGTPTGQAQRPTVPNTPPASSSAQQQQRVQQQQPSSTSAEEPFSWQEFMQSELPNKLAILIGLIVLTRVGVYVRIPGVDVDAFAATMANNGLMGYVDGGWLCDQRPCGTPTPKHTHPCAGRWAVTACTHWYWLGGHVPRDAQLTDCVSTDAPMGRCDAPASFCLAALSGGSISKVGLFSLGIIPYINASIVLQLFSTAFPSLKKMQREEGAQVG